MKKTLKTLALAGAVLASAACSEKLPQKNADRQISLNPVTAMSTKAAIDGTYFPDDRTMVVSAYYNAKTGDSGNYFKGSTFEKVGNNWSSDKLWPVSGDLSLLAYSADGLAIDPAKDAEVSYDTNVAEGVTLTVPDNADKQCDILWASAKNQSYISTGNPLIFNHAEALVIFTAKSNINFNKPDNLGITITKITIENAFYSGSVHLKDDGSCEWSNLGSKADKDLPGLTSYEVKTKSMDLDSWQGQFGIGENGIILPAQSATSFIIEYTLHNGRDASGNRLDNTGLKFRYDCEGEWKAGVKTHYLICFDLNDVRVSPSISNWTEQSAEYVDAPGNIAARYDVTAGAGTEVCLPEIVLQDDTEAYIDWGDGSRDKFEYKPTKAAADDKVNAKHTYTTAYSGTATIVVRKGFITVSCLIDDHAKLTIVDSSYIDIQLLHEVGEIAYWQNSKISFAHYTDWNDNLGKALCVCVIPTTHAMAWGDGKARFMALETFEDINIAPFGEEVNEDSFSFVSNFTDMPFFNNVTSEVEYTAYGGEAFIASDAFSDNGTQNIVDALAYYNSDDESYWEEGNVLSPYAADGSFNAAYSGGSVANGCSDLDGYQNTLKHVEYCINTEHKYFQHAWECRRNYSTSGLHSEEWYWPSVGELIYVGARSKTIGNALNACGGTPLGPMSSSTRHKIYIFEDEPYYNFLTYYIVDPIRGFLACGADYNGGNISARPFISIE